MKAALLELLKTNWKGALVGLAIGAVACWFLKPDPQPAVHLQEEAHATENSKATTETTAHEGPSEEASIDFDPEPGAPAAIVNVPGIGPVAVPAGQRIEGVKIKRDAGSDTATHAVAEGLRTEDHKLDLTITPQSRPSWALQAGVDDVLGARALRVEVRHRILGPIWLGASAVPTRMQLGVSAAVEF
jgi:hypothetical protein